MTSINNTTQRVGNYNLNNDLVANTNSAIKEVTESVSADAQLKRDKPVSEIIKDANTKKEKSLEKPKNEVIKKEAIEAINKSLPNTEAIFGIHDKTNRVTIKIIDKDTRKVVREFPPEKTLDLIAKVWEMAGILVDEKR